MSLRRIALLCLATAAAVVVVLALLVPLWPVVALFGICALAGALGALLTRSGETKGAPAETVPSNRPFVLLLVTCAAAAFSVLAIAFGWWPIVVLLALCAAAGVGLAYARSRLDDFSSEPASSLVAPDGGVSVSSIHLSAETAFVFARAIAYPREIYARISEHVEGYHRSLMSRAALTVIVEPDTTVAPPVTPAEWVVPLLLVPKRPGAVIDGLKITDAGGRRLSTLDQDRLNSYVLGVVEVLVRVCGERAAAAYPAASPVVERAVTAGAYDPARATEADAAIRSLPTSTADEEAFREVLATLVQRLARYRVIAVPLSDKAVRECGWPHAHRFVVERRVIASIADAPTGGSPGRVIRLLDTWRLALGVPLNRIYYPVTEPERTKSYHLEVAGPPGTFLAGCQVLAQPSREGEEPGVVTGVLQPRLGQRRAHLYARAHSGSRTYLATKFFERSPGSFASLTMVSVAAAAVICLLAWTEISQRGQSAPAWLLPALLAVPIAAAALAGFDIGREHRYPSLLSRGLTLGVVSLSVVAFTAATLSTPARPLADWLWLVLAGFSLALSVSSVSTWVLRFHMENRLVRRTVSDELGAIDEE